MDLQSLFNQAAQSAERGQYREAANSYVTFLDAVQGPRSPAPSAQRPQLVRSAAFNLAQVYNKIGDFSQALRYVELGLSHSPTEFGRAIALAAKGEALCGLGRTADGQAAFNEAASAHPVVGRLNSADSMTRLGAEGFWRQAEEWVGLVLASFGPQLDGQRRAEVSVILGKVAARRGDIGQARAQFEKALTEYPDFEDAKLQLRLLTQPRGQGEEAKGGLFSRLFGRK